MDPISQPSAPKKNSACLLYIDDDIEDIEFLKYGLKSADVKVDVIPIHDGVQALSFLRREGMYKDAPRPHLILLDLNMPKKDGREVLADLKADENLKDIPVIIFTSSDSRADIAKTYDTGSNYFLTKPIGLSEYEGVFRVLKRFLPKEDDMQRA